MPANREWIKERLGALGLPPQREQEILRELSEHVEDLAAASEAHGMGRGEALHATLDSVPDWTELREAILSAEAEEANMNYRTKTLWLPVLGALTLSNVLLAGFQIFGPASRFRWLGGGTSLEPYLVFFVPWLVTQPGVGAIAAYWSRRAGGTMLHQSVAALAPAIALLGLFVLILPFSVLLDKQVEHNFRLQGFLILTLLWLVLPSVPLLLGAAPFLRRAHAQISR